jgi:hypothetical protein
MALELAIISALAGAVLGLRYNVLVLVPAVGFAMLFAVITGILRADGLWSIVLTTVLLGVAVQLGYLAGVAIYAVVERGRTARGKGRNQLNSSLGAAWPQTWQMPFWQLTPSTTIASLRRRQPPQA